VIRDACHAIKSVIAAAIHVARITHHVVSDPQTAYRYALAVIVSAISAFWMCSRFSACL
jgi:hypothetical protein